MFICVILESVSMLRCEKMGGKVRCLRENHFQVNPRAVVTWNDPVDVSINFSSILHRKSASI